MLASKFGYAKFIASRRRLSTSKTIEVFIFIYREFSEIELQWAKALNKPLQETDPELFNIIESEKVNIIYI